MKNTVYFSNCGLIDLTAVSTFGVNVKESDNPFGFFGTGLKYAIAILLRNGHEITIWRGMDKHELTLKPKTIRGKEFNIVCLDGAEIGFTDELGKQWELWQAFRELYCNTMDEGGDITDEETKPSKNRTLLIINGDGFYAAYRNKTAIVLDTTPVAQLNGLDVHENQSKHIYFRTIRVADLQQPSKLTYNIISQIELTEDRTVKNEFTVNRIIREALLQGDNEWFIREFINAPEGSYEAKIDLNWSTVPGPTFMRIVSGLDFKSIINLSLLAVYQKHANKNKLPAPVEKTDIEIKQLEKAVTFCNSIGYPVDKFEINITADLHHSRLGAAYKGQIYISRRTFQMGTKQVAATVMEEYMHLSEGYEDETYEFQTYLFDVIVSLGERLMGEPI